MDIRPTNTSSHPATSSLQRGTPILRLLLIVVAGLALLGLALAVPVGMGTAASIQPPNPEHPEQVRDSDIQVNAPQRPPLLLAGVTNGGFESGDFADWPPGPGGSAAHVDVLQESDWKLPSVGPRPAPTEGNYFALLCTGSGPVDALNHQGNIDGNPLVTNDFDTSIITKTISLTDRDVPVTLSFDWSFLTDEGRYAQDAFDDFFQVTLNGVVILAGSRPGGTSPYPDVAVNGYSYQVTGSGYNGTTMGCIFDEGRSPFQTFRMIISNPGDYKLVFLVADAQDADLDSGLLIDNVQLTPEIDLEITKTATPDPAIAGEPLIYEITVENHGTGRALDVVVTDTLPAEVYFITDTLPIYADTTLPQGCTFSSGQLSCDLGDVLGGESISFEIEVDVNSDALANGTEALVNTAEVDSLTADGNSRNDIVILGTILQDSADLRVVKVGKPDTTVEAGEIFTYTIHVDNLGPSHARNVVLTDTILSSGAFTLVSSMAEVKDPNRSNSCTTSDTPGGKIVTCQLDDSLEPQGEQPRNGRWIIQVEVMANYEQDVDNEVLVFSADPDGPLPATPDPNISNNRATDFISVTDVADLGMTKIGKDAGTNPDGNPFTVLAGESITWTITVRNDGPSTSENVAVVDILPRGLVEGSVGVEVVTPPGGGGLCTVGTPGDPNEPLICQLGNLAPGDTATVTIVADIDPSYVVDQPNTAYANHLPNDAHLTSDTFDPDEDDNIVFDASVEVMAKADVEVQKADRPDYVIAGEQLEYTLTISNGGPSTAEDVVLLDELPDEVLALYVDVVNEPDATCTIRTTPANIIDCGFGNILPRKVISMVVTSLVHANTPAGTITNAVTVTSVTSDTVLSNNINVTETTDVETEADVEITKVGVPVKVPAGEQVKYTIWVENNGSSDAQDVTVFDLLPDEVVYEIDTNSPMCTRPGNLVGFRAELTGTVATEAAGLATFVLITNTNELLYAVEVTDIDNITGTVLTDHGTNTVALFSGPPPVFDPTHPLVGSVVSPTLATAIKNNPTSFEVIVQTSDFPAGEISGQIEQAVTTMTGEDNIPLHCPIGTLAAGASHQFDIWALVDPATPAGTIITNVGIVTSTTTLGDPDMSNNVASARNLVEGEADLDIRKFGKPDGEVRAGETLTYTVIVDNLGPSAATGVAVKDLLQSSDIFDLLDITSDRDTVCVILTSTVAMSVTVPISATTWPPTSTVEPPLVADISERLELDCTLTGGLEVLDADGPPNSGRWLLTIRVRGDETQDINNVATVLSEQKDPNLDNNQAFVEHDITDVSDLEVTKTAVGEVQQDDQPGGSVTLKDNQVTAGMSLTYTLVITNHGPSTAENVVLQDRLPPWIVVTGFDTSQGDCDTGTPGEPLDRLTCGLGTLAPGASATITITADVPSWVPGGTILENDAFVYSDIFDDTNANNFATNLTDVSARADLGIAKADNPDPVVAGELLNYTITVANTGPSDAKNVVVVDELPNDGALNKPLVTYISDTDTCYQDPIDRAKLTCSLGDIPAGDDVSFDILVQVNPDVVALGYTTITNTVTVSSTIADPYDANNTITETTTVEEEADLFITKVDVPAEPRLDETFEPDKAIAGEEHRYLITFGNDGPSVARSVNVTDTLDLKQVGTPLGDILGETFVRCEPVDPDDLVTCISATNTVTVTGLKVANQTIIPPGNLDPGDEYSFYLITKVDPGYVLDADDLTAEDTAWVSSDTPDPNTASNQDSEQTEIIAEADLKVSKTDTPDPGQNLHFDPVTHKSVYTYTLTIENLGPSDAAKVVLIDTLPVDATFMLSETVNSQCYFRDDGTLFCLVGEDPNNLDHDEAGRLNVGITSTVKIVVQVDASAVDFLENCVEVKAIARDDFPFRLTDPIPPANFQDGRTPTPDPNLANNTFCETTTLMNPAVQVDKKVYVRSSPARGIDNSALDPVAACATLATDDILTLPGDELTYCYTITNEGDTWLSSVTLRDAPTTIVRTPTISFTVAYPGQTDQPALRGDTTWVGGSTDEAQTITIATAEPAKAVLAPKGVADDYDHILIVRSFTVDFPAGGVTFKGTNTARVDARPSTKFSTPLPGIAASGDCEPKLPEHVCDTDLLHDTLALPVLEETTKEWAIYEDNGDDLPSPGDVIEYTVTISNTGIIEATGNATVEFYNELYNWINPDADDLKVPGWLINGSVSAAIHVHGLEPDTGLVIDADVQPPDLALGEDLLLRTYAPAIGGGYLELTYPSAVVLDSEILKGNNPGDDEVHVATRLAIPPVGYLLRFDGVTYDRPIPVTFSLRIKYQVRIKETKYVRLGTIVLSHGWVKYNEIGLFDQRFPDFDPANPDAHTAANKVANNHNGTPGRDWERPEFPGWPEIPPDVEPTNFLGPRFDEYPRPELPGADPYDDDPTWFELKRLPRRIQLPAIDNEDGWGTHIQVQNGGDEDTAAIVFFWAESSGECQSNDLGPIGHACKRILENAVWPLKTQSIPSAAKSAIVYSVDKDLFEQACDAADYVFFEPSPLDPRSKSTKWRDWEDDYEGTGEAIAVIVQRQGPNDHGTMVSSAYPGISENREGGGPVYKYFAPYAMRQYHNLDTEMIIHNSGRGCASIVLNYQKQGDCVFSYDEDIVLAPGESVRRRVPAALGAMWLGSIYVESDEPLGIIMDQASFLPSEDRGVLLTYEARPYQLTTDTLFYADLVWREVSGWEASIQVQNLTQHSLPTFVTVEFFDQSGDSILYLGEWVCRAGGATFYLPVVTDLGMEYAGAAVIQSHSQVDYPGENHDGQPIFAVVDLKKTRVYDEALHRWRPTIPGEIQGGAYNALAEGEKKATIAVMLPHLAKARDSQGVTSLIAVRNNSNCNEIGLKLEVTNLVGTVVTYLTNFWLSPGHIKLIDLAGVGTMNPGFVGAGTVEVTSVEQLCDEDNDGYLDEAPTMFSVVVVNKGAESGDVTEVYKGIPVK